MYTSAPLGREEDFQIALGLEGTFEHAWSTALRRVGALSLVWQDKTYIDGSKHTAEVDEACVFDIAHDVNTKVRLGKQANSSCSTQKVTRARSTTNYSDDSVKKTARSDECAAVHSRHLTRQLGSPPRPIPINEDMSETLVRSTRRVESNRVRRKVKRRRAQVHDVILKSAEMPTMSDILAATSRQDLGPIKRFPSAQTEAPDISIFANTESQSTRHVTSDDSVLPSKMHPCRTLRRAASLPPYIICTTSGGSSTSTGKSGQVSDDKRLYNLEAQVSDMFVELGAHSSHTSPMHKKEMCTRSGDPCFVRNTRGASSQHKAKLWHCKSEIATAPLALNTYTRDIELADSDSSHTDSMMDMTVGDTVTILECLPAQQTHYSQTTCPCGTSTAIICNDLDILRKPCKKFCTIVERIERTDQYIENIAWHVSVVTNMLTDIRAQSHALAETIGKSQNRLAMASQNIISNIGIDAYRVPRSATIQQNKVQAQKRLRSLHKKARFLRTCSVKSKLDHTQSNSTYKPVNPADLGAILNLNEDKAMHGYGKNLHLQTYSSDRSLEPDRHMTSLRCRPVRSVQARLKHIDSQWAKLCDSFRENNASCQVDAVTNSKTTTFCTDEVVNCALDSSIVIDGLRVIEYAMRTMLDCLESTSNQKKP
ncbi:hypothetical protein COEREDRAFT_83036 [Coemansia reversa NRRL 1564]|uniref:Uncharacterized protein n=1 Tax=Coemansia reversa (strain ATCC 12441 / NRRL 1564) TaxID=763665 RepID=A0A2G5B4P6_COERN|nr:hypothetical protein COEREDRAFT_83036 [Coemansia reversa NRRL 1564]|eukprot:PIA13976.1 hypothetical protein COEREDRAFT_83036 [Coemansia reversa NRRL 1564]